MNLSLAPRLNVVESTMTSRFREFVRIKPLIILGSMVGEYPLEFLCGVYKVLSAIRVTSREKTQLASYKLRDISQIWYT